MNPHTNQSKFALGRHLLDCAVQAPSSDYPALVGLAERQADTRLEEILDRISGRDHWFTGQRVEGTAYLRITDNIGFAGSHTADDFVSAIGDAESIELFVESVGGDTELCLRLGKLIMARNSTATVINKSYSAASILYLSANRRLIQGDAKIMLHQATTYTVGGEERHRMSIRMLGKLHSPLVDFICARTKQPPEVVREWLTEGRDKWFTASEAIAAGICHEIITPAVLGQCFPQATPPRLESDPGGGGDFPDEHLALSMFKALGRIRVKSKDAFGDQLRDWWIKNTYD